MTVVPDTIPTHHDFMANLPAELMDAGTTIGDHPFYKYFNHSRVP